MNKDIESVGIVTKFPGQKFRVIITVYRPPKGNVNRCYTKLEEMLKLPSVRNKEVWIAGDLNVDTLHRNSNKCKCMFAFVKNVNFVIVRPNQHTFIHSENQL